MIDKLLRYSAALSWKHPKLVIWCFVLASAVGGLYAAMTLQMNANTEDLIAPDRPFMADYRKFLQEFGDLEYIYVVVDPKGDHAQAQAAVEALGKRLSDVPGLPEVYWKLRPHEQLRIATRAMTQDELAQLSQVALAFGPLLNNVAPAQMLSRAQWMLEQAINPAAELDETQRRDMAAGALFLLQTMASAAPQSQAAQSLQTLLQPPETQYLKSDSGQLYFLLVMPLKDYSSLAVIEGPLRRIRAEIDVVAQQYPAIEIGLTGKPVLQADEMSTSNRDMMRASFIALTLVALAFMFLSGGIIGPLMAIAALVVGIGLTFGFTAVAVGQLNLLSVVFTLVLVGLGIDFGIHLFTRYREERVLRGVKAALIKTMLTAGRGNVFGAITSSIAFLVALFTDFQGLRELGLIAGAGLLLCLLTMTLMLPSLLSMYSQWRGAAPTGSLQAWRGRRESRLLSLMLRHPRIALALVMAATLLTVPMLRSLHFDSNLLELQARGLESVEWEHRLLNDSDGATWFGVLIVDDIADMPSFIEKAQAQQHIGLVRSVLDVIALPTPEREQLRRSLHRWADADLPDVPAKTDAQFTPEQLQQTQKTLQTMARFAALQSPEAAQPLLATREDLGLLADQLSQQPGQTTQRVQQAIGRSSMAITSLLAGDRASLREALPAAIRQMYVSPHGRHLIMMHPTGNVWEFEAMGNFIADMRTVSPDITGAPITHYQSLIEMKQGFLQSAALAFAFVWVLILIDFRHIGYATLAMIPLTLGLLWTLQWMSILGLNFNLANFFSLPILIGIGVDNGIHIIHRYREGGPQRFQFGSTRRALILTATTTSIGFGCLMIAHHRGLQSLGIVMAIGMVCCAVASLLVLPPILALLERMQILRHKRGNSPT